MHYRLCLTGLTCNSCVANLRSALQNHFSILSISQDELLIDKADALEPIIQAIQETGFDVSHYEALDLEGPLFPKANNTGQSQQSYGKISLITACIGLPLMILGMLGFIPSPLSLVGQWVGWTLAGLSLFVMSHLSSPLYKEAWIEIKNQRPGMNTLFALGTGAAFLFSLLVLLIPTAFLSVGAHTQFAAIFITTSIVCLGRAVKNWIEARSYEQARSKMDYESLFLSWQPRILERVSSDNTLESMDFRLIKAGDTVRVSHRVSHPTAISGVDGTYCGEASVRVIVPSSGEIIERPLHSGEEVSAGMQFLLEPGAYVDIKSDRPGRENTNYLYLKKVASEKSAGMPFPMVESISRWFTPSIIAISLLSGLFWVLFGPVGSALAMGISTTCSILLCACPCAFGLSSPISTLIMANKAAAEGIYFPNMEAMETAGLIEIVVIDKTGTVTETAPKVHSEYWIHEVNSVEAWSALAALERHYADHPSAKAILQYIHKKDGIVELPAFDTTLIPAQGIQATIEKEEWRIGQYEWIASQVHDTMQHPLYPRVQEALSSAMSPLCVMRGNQWIGVITTQARIKKGVRESIKRLKAQGLRLYLLSGDYEDVSIQVAKDIGLIPREATLEEARISVLARKTPEQKRAFIKKLQSEGQVVAMIGDGGNDLGAIQQADVGIAVGLGRHLAKKTEATLTSSVILEDGNIATFETFLNYSKSLKRNIAQNLFIAMGYNFVSILIAMGALYPFGILSTPVFSSIAMGVSSLLVLFNATRLEGHKKPRWLKLALFLFGVACIGFGSGLLCSLICGTSMSALWGMSSSLMWLCKTAMVAGYVACGGGVLALLSGVYLNLGKERRCGSFSVQTQGLGHSMSCSDSLSNSQEPLMIPKEEAEAQNQNYTIIQDSKNNPLASINTEKLR